AAGDKALEAVVARRIGEGRDLAGVEDAVLVLVDEHAPPGEVGFAGVVDAVVIGVEPHVAADQHALRVAEVLAALRRRADRQVVEAAGRGAADAEPADADLADAIAAGGQAG